MAESHISRMLQKLTMMASSATIDICRHLSDEGNFLISGFFSMGATEQEETFERSLAVNHLTNICLVS